MIAWYYLAFFAISVATLGMTVGAVWVYLRRTIRARPAADHPVRFCIRHSRRHAGFGDGSVLPDHDRCPVAHHNHLVGLLLAVMAVPYVFSGVVVSLALERFSIYLGHPIYSLGVCLFSLILASGLGSLASDWFRLDARPEILVWGAIVAVYLMMIAFLLPAIFQATTDQERMVRIAISLLVIMPLGFLLGFAFPTGMRLVEDRPATHPVVLEHQRRPPVCWRPCGASCSAWRGEST